MQSVKKNRSLAQVAAEKIIQYIKDEQMEPGDRLPTEYELAKFLEVGRGTVREAIRSLVSRNILEVRQGAGTFVSHKNGIPEDPLGLAFEKDRQNLALDMMAVRLMLEPEIAALAASNATDLQIKALREQCDKVESLILHDQPYRKEDAKFHQILGECSGNRVIRKLVSVITSSVELNIGVTRDKFKMNTVALHRSITNSVAHRDSVGAKYNMIMHLNVIRSGIIDEMDEKKRELSQEI